MGKVELYRTILCLAARSIKGGSARLSGRAFFLDIRLAGV